MKIPALLACVVAVCAATTFAQITPIASTALTNPVVMDFDTAAPAPGPILPTDPYFTAFGLCAVSIVNAPGMHFASGDTLSSGFIGNGLVSVNNTLAIAAPGGVMDNHQMGAGWSFRLDPGTIATQFGCIVIDQVNHMMAVETWVGGVMQNTYTFTMTGGFPNPYIYFEDLLGFDEVRFMNVAASTGGWGVDDFTLGNVIGTPTGQPCPPPPPPPYQINSATSSLTISGVPDPGGFAPITKSAPINTPETLDLATTTIGVPFDIAITAGTTIPSLFVTPGNQVVNINLGSPTLTFVNGGALPDLTTTAFPALSFQVSFTAATQLTASTQMVVADPLTPDGFSLSHAAEYSAL